MKSQHQETHVFNTRFGIITGLKKDGIIKAKSIRYAYSKRFQKPVPLKHFIYDNRLEDKIPVCPQKLSPLVEKMIGRTPVEEFVPEESTQYLSVNRPGNILENEKLPVVVWIHGGSHEIGCGDLPTADPAEWVKEQHIIVVTVSYRLGLFGFLGGDEKRPPNLGLLDMIEALKWIKINITDFGGDPENVTLLGQSSGGDAIAHLMISKGAAHLFHRVIIQSAPLGLRHNRKKMSAEFLKKTEDIKDEVDVYKMMDDYGKLVPSIMKYGLKAAMPFGVQYGFPPLCNEEESIEQWSENAKRYDVLIGFNNDETAFYLKTSEALNKYFGKGLGLKIMDKTVEKTTDIIYGAPARQFAENYAKGGGNIYFFKIHSNLKENVIGAPHCIDLPLIFGNESAWKSSELLKDIPWERIQKHGRKLRALWAEFARNGTISDSSERPEILELRKIQVLQNDTN
ncbi:Para-nitrobenzyl esterase [Chryseobacterium nakagawai]|uniref:Carboxylic ester hydrolase n=1 Tax=Chryseobacterium nakagawai TaxID=1241982 RepID=A0AAD0YM65_CHRNA|nr:carboxylesterase family protein [Chryseobacterium nakagawai]AZA91074.1 carboxylesterase/lipase family protein [Chryseobacterium nakagawai]VEH22633.1 Para-nitrobenzyl esterase [Chryseobacterium nakagawai]